MNDSSTPQVIDAPAPWDLNGRGYVSLMKFDARTLDDERFTPPGLRGKRLASPYAVLMLVDYATSPVGPYHELLLMSGRYDFGDTRPRWFTSAIVVSTMDSVVNGRRNWGVPKQLAQFEVSREDNGIERVRVTQDGQPLATLAYRRRGFRIPITTALMPKRLLAFGQQLDGKAFYYHCSARGSAQPASLLSAESDPARFPDLAAGKPVMSVHHPRFNLLFPTARIESL